MVVEVWLETGSCDVLMLEATIVVFIGSVTGALVCFVVSCTVVVDCDISSGHSVYILNINRLA